MSFLIIKLNAKIKIRRFRFKRVQFRIQRLRFRAEELFRCLQTHASPHAVRISPRSLLRRTRQHTSHRYGIRSRLRSRPSGYPRHHGPILPASLRTADARPRPRPNASQPDATVTSKTTNLYERDQRFRPVHPN